MDLRRALGRLDGRPGGLWREQGLAAKQLHIPAAKLFDVDLQGPFAVRCSERGPAVLSGLTVGAAQLALPRDC